MSKIAIFVLLLVLSALAAACYGAVHNQMSFTIGPDYFHAIKFPQFGIAEALPDRVGAAMVGVMASWWMGPIVGAPAFLYGLFAVARPGSYFGAGLGAIGFVLLLATLAACIGLVAGLVLSGHALLDGIATPTGADREDVLRAGLMHDASYVGGALGALVAFWPMRRAVLRDRDLWEAAHAT